MFCLCTGTSNRGVDVAVSLGSCEMSDRIVIHTSSELCGCANEFLLPLVLEKKCKEI